MEQHQKRLKELQEADPTKAGEIATKQSWQKAMQRAEGQKILDNPQLLKKKIKRIERSKRKSEREWKERNEEVTRSIKEQQDRRNKNLADRAKKKLERRREKVSGGYFGWVVEAAESRHFAHRFDLNLSFVALCWPFLLGDEEKAWLCQGRCLIVGVMEFAHCLLAIKFQSYTRFIIKELFFRSCSNW